MKYLLKYKYIIIAIIIIFFIIISCFFVKKPSTEIDTLLEPPNLIPIIDEKKHIKVDIKGAVKNPGVYEMEENSRVNDLISKSGGLLSNADLSTINLSKLLKDENVVIVYTKEELNKIREGNVVVKYIDKECICPKIEKNTACIVKESTSNNGDKIININIATIAELSTLPGIGESKAKAIIKYRETNNSFKSIEEIKKISGIGDAIFNKIKTLIKI
ncbi:MAG: helix-hairpin-helix domain-containing protein [Bacilli bacterium]